MLTSLSIRDVVLIDRLDLSFTPGLSVLTGETGAGKSILLDALGLVLGARADSGLVRHGAAQASVSAEFDLPADHAAYKVLQEQGLPTEDRLLLRRLLSADGRSRAFVNDQAASIGLLRQLGSAVVEIQGQFEQHGLLDPTSHRDLLDAFAAAPGAVSAAAQSWTAWRTAQRERSETQNALAKSAAEQDWLRHTLAELDAANLEAGEEASLVERRAFLMHRAQVMDAITAAAGEISSDRGASRALNAAARTLEKVRDKAQGKLDEAIAAIERGLIEIDDCAAYLDGLTLQGDDGEGRLDRIEDRLVELRSLARKHNTAIDALPALQEDIARRLAAIEDGDSGLKKLTVIERQRRQTFEAAAMHLSEIRQGAANRLEAAIMAELPALKLDRARFTVDLAPQPQSDWDAGGAERVTFQVATNPGSAPGALGKIASAGELSRFLLALKLALARISTVPTIVFDEVDSGIGGATAAAVGERLQRLGREIQVLVVTHSPQVAARGLQHWRVEKKVENDMTTTRVDCLGPDERREEIARMLSGAEVTSEARAAAESLLAAQLALHLPL